MLTLKKITNDDLRQIHQVAYTQDNPFWAQMNAPYFDEYQKLDYQAFLDKEAKFYLRDQNLLGIFVDDKIIGIVSSYWESKVTRWMELGILIFDDNYYNKGYGSKALSQWITITFDTYPEIERVGITSWSGNLAMIALAQKLNMQEEARIRKVRYYNGFYYDSIKYGILRDEWQKFSQK